MQGNINRANQIANQPYQTFGGPRIADFTDDQQAAMAATRGAMGQSTGAYDEARDFLRTSAEGVNPERIQAAQMQAPQLAQAMGYNPATSQQAQLGNAQGFDAAQVGRTDVGSAQGYNAAMSGAAGANATMGAQAMGAYDNPFQTQVIDRAMGDLNRAEDRQLSEARRRAAGANSFGGSRTAILEGEIMRGFNDQRGDISANLRSQGFNTALQAGQTDAGRMTDVSQFNAGQQTQVNEANAGRQDAAARYAADMGNNFQLTQAQMDAARANQNAGFAQDANRFGADSANAFMREQAGLDAQRNEANAGRSDAARRYASDMGNNFALQQAGMEMEAAGANMASRNQANQFNATQGLEAQLAQRGMQAGAGAGLQAIEGADRNATNQDIDRLMNVGALEQRMRQGGLDLAVDDFNRQRDWNMRGLNALIQATGNVPAGMFGSTSQKAPSNFLGQVGALAGGVGALFSDRRLKQDIKPLGGGVYEYAYIWDPATRVRGVMADEVPARFRIRGMSGFDVVDYGLMALEAA
jgi:hypothetical protein